MIRDQEEYGVSMEQTEITRRLRRAAAALATVLLIGAPAAGRRLPAAAADYSARSGAENKASENGASENGASENGSAENEGPENGALESGAAESAQAGLSAAGDLIRGSAQEIGSSVSETALDPYSDRPDIDPGDWMYILANPWNDIGSYMPELAPLEGQQFDVRIVDAMSEFAAAARSEGLSVFLSSGYRSYETQTYLFNRKAAEYGEEVAQTIVARPGTSEHQTGLCCDITDRYYEMKDSSLEDTELYRWMSRHCQEYGFIVRFPKGREDVTGIIYEPWHFRYVGVEAASYIMEHDLTLEEFLELYE